MSTKRFLPLLFTFITFLFLIVVLFLFIKTLNFFPVKGKIALLIRPIDIVTGIIIYLKTSIDFALFIGTVMEKNKGWKKRIVIEGGTAIGNALGTCFIFSIWFFFKEAPILLTCMILLSSLVLLRMAQEGLEKYLIYSPHPLIEKGVRISITFLNKINSLFTPLFSLILPNTHLTRPQSLPYSSLFFFSFTIPFLLGLDDFAGYIPLFTIINVFSFCIGVFFAHMVLNMSLFAFPRYTVKLTTNPLVTVLGSIVFIGLSFWGIYEAIHLAQTTFLLFR